MYIRLMTGFQNRGMVDSQFKKCMFIKSKQINANATCAKK